MKRLLLLTTFLSFCFLAKAQNEIEIALQPGYTDEIYYDFSSQEVTSYNASDWEIAFMRTSATNLATRINGGIGIEVYEASNDPDDYDSIDVTNIANWAQLYNSATDWNLGAFDKGSATYGWGEYDMPSHTVVGTVVFVLKYPDASYKKFMIEEYVGGYSFKYATWDADAGSWEANQTAAVSNSDNPNKFFNYYSLTDNTEVAAEPEEWDLVFRKYVTDLNGTMYPVSGVLQSSTLKVATNVGETEAYEGLTYAEEINTIGHDWKEYNGSEYTVDAEKQYYVKKEDGTIYQLHFTSFEGSATGNLTFQVEQLSNLSTVKFDDENSFTIYPNPSTNKQVNLVYENRASAQNAKVQIFDMKGSKVYETKLQADGFYNQPLRLGKLSAGMYMVKITAGNFSSTKKLILN